MLDRDLVTNEDIRTAHAITPLFYEAVLQPEKWQFVLERLKIAIGCDVAQIVYGSMDPPEIYAAHNVGVSEEAQRAWMTFDHSPENDPRNEKVINFPNKPLIANQLVSDEEFHASKIYKEVFEPHGFYDSMAVFVPIEGAGFMLTCGCINRVTSPGFDERSLARFQLYVPHLRQVAKIAQRLNFQADLLNMLATVMDQGGLATLILNGSGRLHYANQRAKDLLDKGNVFQLANDTVTVAGYKSRTEFADAVKSCGYQSYNGGEVPKRVDLVLNDGNDATKSYYVTVSSIEQRMTGAVPAGAKPYFSMVVINDPEVSFETPAEKLQRLYGLTESEGRIMLAFGSGQSVAEIAGDLNRKDETVRSHLRSVRDKTGIRTKSKMAQIVANLAE